MKPLGVVAATATICCVMTACSAGPSPEASPGPSPMPATGPPVAPDKGEEPGTSPSATPSREPASPAAAGPARRSFGKAFTYGNGLRVRVDPPEPFTPSPWVEPRKGTATRLVVTIHNRTGEEFNPSQLRVTLRSPYAQAVQIFDHESGVMARPEERLESGKSVTFGVGYWVTDPDMVVEFAPGFSYDPIVVGR